MAVTEGKLSVGDTGEKLDTTKVTQTDGTVAHREAVVITDPEKLDNRAQVVKTVNGEYVVLAHDPTAMRIAIAQDTIIEQNEQIIFLLTNIAE